MTLRALEPEDLSVLYQLENNQQHWLAGCSTVPYSRAVLADYIVSQKADIYLDGQVRLAIAEGDSVLGMVDLFNFDARNLRAEVGIAVLDEHQGRGVATLALQKLIDYAQSFLFLEQLTAIVPVSNEASLRLFRRRGFVETCTLREWIKTPSGRADAVLFQLFLKKH